MKFSYTERRIMIVTCDAQFRAALERACTGPEHRIETADCVETAMQIADRRPVCLMVAEASIHDAGDGVRLAKAIHIKNSDTKCFLVVDKDDPVVSCSADNEPWLCFVHRPIRMLRFSVELIDAMKEPCG